MFCGSKALKGYVKILLFPVTLSKTLNWLIDNAGVFVCSLQCRTRRKGILESQDFALRCDLPPLAHGI